MKIDRHHVIARSRGGVDKDRNIVKLPRPIHNALHYLFTTDLPHEQLIKIVNLSSGVLKPEFVMAITNIVRNYKNGGNIYKEKVFKEK